MCFSSGRTTLSASGMLLPRSLYDSDIAKEISGDGDRFPVLVLTVASIVEPFLSLKHRENISQVEYFLDYVLLIFAQL